MANLIRLKQIESSSALIAAGAAGGDFSQSVINVVTGEVAVLLDGATVNDITLVNATVTTADADRYSLIVSGAVAVIDANNLPTGSIGDNDTNVPAQIWLNSNSILPTDPSSGGTPQANIIDQGEW